MTYGSSQLCMFIRHTGSVLQPQRTVLGAFCFEKTSNPKQMCCCSYIYVLIMDKVLNSHCLLFLKNSITTQFSLSALKNPNAHTKNSL